MKFRNDLINPMVDPLKYFFGQYGYDPRIIRRVEAGEKYAGIMLRNGKIGVCSTTHTTVTKEDLAFSQPDLSVPAHRIAYNAYLNALLNYHGNYEARKDIFEHIDFSGRKNITMVGYFRPLVEKFSGAGIDISIFDRVDEDERLTPIDHLDQYLSGSSTVILTSTTISNATFSPIIDKTPANCAIFLLGPSSILDPSILNYKNIKKIYGAVFQDFDDRILDIIADGHGTQTFLKYGKKVNI